MAHVRFTADFDYQPVWHSTIAYKAGMERTVRRECANQAIAAGKAIDLDAAGPRKNEVSDGG